MTTKAGFSRPQQASDTTRVSLQRKEEDYPSDENLKKHSRRIRV